MDLAITIFWIGVGLGALLVGIGVIMVALSLRPLARDTRALANDARRLTRLAETELASMAGRGGARGRADGRATARDGRATAGDGGTGDSCVTDRRAGGRPDGTPTGPDGTPADRVGTIPARTGGRADPMKDSGLGSFLAGLAIGGLIGSKTN